MVSRWGCVPSGGRSADAWPYKSEKQAKVSDWQRSGAGQHHDVGVVAAESENIAVKESVIALGATSGEPGVYGGSE